MVKVPLSNSFLERRDARQKFTESLRAGASLAPPWRRVYVSGSHLDPYMNARLERIVLFASATTDRRARLDSWSISMSGQDRARTGRSGHATNLRSHVVIRPRCAPEWLHARFFQVVFLANEGELTGKTFTTPLNTTNLNTYSETRLLRTLKGNEKRHVLNKVRFIQNKERAKMSDWRCP